MTVLKYEYLSPQGGFKLPHLRPGKMLALNPILS